MRRRSKRAVLLLNSSYEILSRIEFNRALILITGGAASVFESLPNEFIQGPPQVEGDRLRIPWPVSVILRHYVHVNYSVQWSTDDPLAARAAILQRDGFCCMYCGNPASTIDHVFPVSRGGGNTWLNLVAACSACNRLKADRTPEEAGMPLLRPSYAPLGNRFAREQKRIWKALEAGSLRLEEELA